MKKKRIAAIALLVLVCVLLAGCGNDAAKPAATEASVQPQGEPFAEGITDKDFSALRTPGSQEDASVPPKTASNSPMWEIPCPTTKMASIISIT